MNSQLSTIIDIKKWLDIKHVVVPTNWVKACVEFVYQEFSNTNLPVPRIKQLVYEQWLVADLEEIGSTTLPPELFDRDKTLLSGNFALQVIGIRDVGKPAYAQLKQLEGSKNDDIEVSAAPKAFAPEWESKPTRMLILNLTDGVSVIQGMEYKPITFLSPNLPPGIKVLITGPLECRYGILMLTKEKIQILGGEVDKYQHKYSREEVLREALKLPNRERETVPQPNHNENTVNQSYNGVQRSTIDSEHVSTVPLNSLTNERNRPCLPSYHSKKDTRPHDDDDIASIDNFDLDDDDDFVKSLDYQALDEIEKANTQVCRSISYEEEEDEDMLREMQEFQENAGSGINQHLINSDVDVFECHSPAKEKTPKVHCTLLSSVDHNSNDEYSITIKGYILNVMSRLECKANTGWHLTAKVSDGTLSIEADFHDNVLAELVGMSAKDMMLMQIQARENSEIKNKMMKAVGNCKNKLQELNCFMEIKFSPGARACVVKCFEES